jgi:L-arabinose isomerase
VGRSIVPDLSGYQVWFLTGSQNLYGEQTLRQVAEQSRQIADTLAGCADIPVSVEWQPVLTDGGSIRAAALRANADERVVGLIVWMHTFSPAKMWIAGLDSLDKPLLHPHTQANVALPWADIDFDFMNLNQAAHGDRERPATRRSTTWSRSTRTSTPWYRSCAPADRGTPRRATGPPSSWGCGRSLRRAAVRDLAEMARVELLTIDASTRLPEFTNQLRWNQAYYRLLQGL